MQQSQLEQDVMKSLGKFTKSFGSLQETLHKDVLLKVVYYSWKHGKFHLSEKVLNELSNIKQGFRVESVAYWLEQIAGITYSYNETKGFYAMKLAKDAIKSAHSVPFTYDADHMALVKLESNRFWKIAPVVIKPLKAPELDKATASAEIQLARGLSVGLLSQAEVEEHILGMLERVQKAIDSKGVKKWTTDFLAQQNPVEPEETEESDLSEELLSD